VFGDTPFFFRSRSRKILDHLCGPNGRPSLNTPAHVITSLLVIRNPREDMLLFTAIVVGAVLPDAAMIVFYGIQKFVLGTPESIIWSEKYYDPVWQNVFDAFNSIPLILLALLGTYAARLPRLSALLVSMLIHCLCDLPVHHDDGHRHFFPISDWRFESPVSYWDPAHHGNAFLLFELALVIGGTLWLVLRAKRAGLKVAYATCGLVHVGFGAFAMLHWGAAGA